VWLGNDDNKPMKKVTGGGLPAALWHDYMVEAERDRAPLPLLGDMPTAAPKMEELHAAPPEEAPRKSDTLGDFIRSLGGGR